jgi:small subunit ribosomal protein S8
MMTDPIGDMLTRMRNALAIRRKSVQIPRSKLREQVAQVLVREGYVTASRVLEAKDGDTGPQGWIEVDLKYGPEGEDVIHSITRTSRPGRRIYKRASDLKPVLNGLGITIISTSSGILSDREAREKNVGGEILATIY